jgi:hypothetical protein
MSKIWYGLAKSLAYPSGEEGGNLIFSFKWLLPVFATRRGRAGGRGWPPCDWCAYILHTVILLEGFMVVWTWSGREACLFWSCIDLIVVKVKVSRANVPFYPIEMDIAHTGQLPNGQICMDEPHLLPNNPARQKYRYTSVPTEVALVAMGFKKTFIKLVPQPYQSACLPSLLVFPFSVTLCHSVSEKGGGRLNQL